MAESVLERISRGLDPGALLKGLSEEEQVELLHLWEAWARPEQLPPEGDWRIWVYLGGRGAGKTRAASEFIRSQVEHGKAKRIALVARSRADARDVLVEGESGILAVSHPDFRPIYEPSKRRLTWPNGAIATTFSAEDPEQLRGPQHDLAWLDELAKYRNPDAVWDQLMFGLRLLGPDGSQPRCVVTTTPRPIPLVIDLVRGERKSDGKRVRRPDVAVSSGSTYDNAANLAPKYLEDILSKYEGTTLGRQEIDAAILDEIEGALWTHQMIERDRISVWPELERVVVAIDPTMSTTRRRDETGIVVAGRKGEERYVLADWSVMAPPGVWARRALKAYSYFEADYIVAEANKGGSLIRDVIRAIDQHVPIRIVHATRGKRTRAEPVAALYEQRKVHHVRAFPELEDQMCTWLPGDTDSPDRLDALVWAMAALGTARKQRRRGGVRVAGS